MGNISESGYGKITIKVDGKEKTVYVHRAAYEAFYNVTLPRGRKHPLRHKCHIACCWRPDHLIPGTPKSNTADAIKRGTQTNGWRLMHERRRQEKHIKDILGDK
jgi:hypothetical protein